MSLLQKFDVVSLDQIDIALAAEAATALEQGEVLIFPKLTFALADQERRMIAKGNAAGNAKNISFNPQTASLKGTGLQGQEGNDLIALMSRFGDFAEALVRAIVPAYGAGLTRMRTSFRPVEISGREYSWRKDDRRRHVDAFPSSPTQGDRILRVFANVDQNATPRIWRVGPNFEAYARAFLPKISTRQLPGMARLMAMMGITKSRRSQYDQIMLGLHDAAKRDLDWQASSPAEEICFAPGQVWMTYTDQVPHSVISGQNALEQTFIVAHQMLQMPEQSPAAILSRLSGVNCLPR
jgi:hypothetical protein